MSGIKPSWEKVIVFILVFAAACLIFYGTTLAVNEHAPEGVHTSSVEGVHTSSVEGVHTSSVEGEQQPGGHDVTAEGEGHGADRSGDIRDLIIRTVNFVLMVIILIWALKKADIKGLLSKRIEDIRQKLETLRNEKDEAEKSYHDIEAKLKVFEKERIEILDQYKKEGEAEKTRIIAEANLRVQQIIDQAEATIEQEMQSARDKLKQEVAGLAAQTAEEIIAREINDQDQDRLVQDFIEKVGKIH
jgi:F-type H+-transporting ATPase subunit b